MTTEYEEELETIRKTYKDHLNTLKTYYENEIKRLQEGSLTNEEFHNLCHNTKCVSREEFERGCLEYQNKIYGDKNL